MDAPQTLISIDSLSDRALDNLLGMSDPETFSEAIELAATARTSCTPRAEYTAHERAGSALQGSKRARDFYIPRRAFALETLRYRGDHAAAAVVESLENDFPTPMEMAQAREQRRQALTR